MDIINYVYRFGVRGSKTTPGNKIHGLWMGLCGIRCVRAISLPLDTLRTGMSCRKGRPNGCTGSMSEDIIMVGSGLAQGLLRDNSATNGCHGPFPNPGMGNLQTMAALRFSIVNPAISTVVSGTRTSGQLGGTFVVTDCFLLTERDLPELVQRYHPLSASIPTEEIIIGFIYMNKKSAFIEFHSD